MARRRWSLGLIGEAGALAIALFDRRTPWSARLIAIAVGLYLVSPVDLVTDLVPIAGLIDDAMIVPLGLWIAGRFIPETVRNDARAKLSRRA